MKRFILGVICGLTICFATAASNPEIGAILFPTVVTYHINDEVSLSDGEDIILNYKQHLYVPLRSFAEHMGSTVEYLPPGDNGNSKATVSVYKLDDKNFTIFDDSNTVGIGKLDLSFFKFSNKDDPPYLTGTVKFLKPLPADKQLVVSLLNQEGEIIAVSELLSLDYRQAHEMLAGEIAKFSTRFPYVDEPENYNLQLQIVPKAAWNFHQIHADSNLTGAGGLNGFPLIVGPFYGKDEVKLKQPVEIGAKIINISDDDHITIQEDLSFYLDIFKSSDNTKKKVRTLTTKPFKGKIPYMKGSFETSVFWDQKDDQGVQVSAGEYWFQPRLPIHATSTLSSSPEKTVELELIDSMGSWGHITIK